MKSQNNFPEESRIIFQDAWCCWFCGENTADSLHHIVGRGNNGSNVESSIFNSAPLCNQKCHLPNHALLRTEDCTRDLLIQTKKYLDNYGYKKTELDKFFLEQYKRFYK